MRNVVARALVVLTLVGLAPAGARAQEANWSGAYTGLEVGYGWGSVEQSLGDIGGPLVIPMEDVNHDGAVVGGYLGYNWYLDPHWLFGVEGNANWTDIGTNRSGTGATNAVNLKWEKSFRGRLGFLATPSLLLYTTGGYSWIDGNLRALSSPTETHSATFGGWTVGLGGEWELDSIMMLRMQYRYSDYGAQRRSFALHSYDVGATPSFGIVTVGVSFRL